MAEYDAKLDRIQEALDRIEGALAVPAASTDAYLKSLLAVTIWREARGESVEGMRAVAHVIRNRSKAWNQDWDKIISAKNQFTSMSHVEDSQLTMWPDDDSPQFKAIFEIASRVFEGKDVDLTNGAQYYWNPATATSQWFRDEIAAKMQKVAVIGRHEFFRP